MDTSLHKKIKSLCFTSRDGQGHWILKGSRTVWASDVQQVVTTRRAAYAAFRAEIPEGMDVVASCDVKGCIAPDHASLREARAVARGLSLPEQLAALARSEAYQLPDVPRALPEGLTLELVGLVRRLSLLGNSLDQIRCATQLPTHEVMRIRGGVYDEVVGEIERGRRKERKAVKGGAA